VDVIISVIALCLVASVFSKVLERYTKEQAVFLTIAAAVAVLLLMLSNISPVVESMSKLLAKVEGGAAYSSVIVKALGICYVTQLGVDICKDCGENALSTLVEVSGKIALIVLALPLFNKLLDVIGIFSA
jgi:stage III sporulation protein AD